MQRLRKVLIIITAALMIFIILISNSKEVMGISKNFRLGKYIRVAVLAKDLVTDDYLIDICKDFKEIEKKDEKVKFTCYDAKSNQAIQNEIIDKVLKEGVDLILLDPADTRELEDVINKVKPYDVPIIIFNREPPTMDSIKSYPKALYVGTDSKQSGIMQGKILIDEWNKNKEFVDRNNDNIMQYVMLQGERYNMVPIERTKYSVLTVQQAGIQTEELESRVAEWDLELAKSVVESLLLQYGSKIEVIISNDDTMALGAIQALQAYGYNNGDKAKTIPIVGVDAVPEAREFINKGIMLGSVVHDPFDLAQALYSVGMNLVNNRNPVEGTQYKLDDTKVSIHIPFRGYIENIRGNVEYKND